MNEIVASGFEWAVAALYQEIIGIDPSDENAVEEKEENLSIFYGVVVTIGAIFGHRHLLATYLPSSTWEEEIDCDWR